MLLLSTCDWSYMKRFPKIHHEIRQTRCRIECVPICVKIQAPYGYKLRMCK